MTPATTIAERLRKTREAAKIGSSELDKLAGLSIGHVSVIEGRKNQSIDASTAAKLAHALGVSLEWLITGEGQAPTLRAIKAAATKAAARRTRTGTEG